MIAMKDRELEADPVAEITRMMANQPGPPAGDTEQEEQEEAEEGADREPVA